MKLTIFTPTYNRSSLLNRVYQSLLRQTSFDFEWLIIDDGSTDDTKEVIEPCLSNSTFPVRYYKKKNGGKHTAHNFAVKMAQGDYFMCLDSDDQLADDAVKLLIDCIEKCLPGDGIIAYKIDGNGRLLSDEFPNGLSFTNTVDLTMKYRCNGEFTIIYPTDILRRYLFPVFSGERFITECVLYDKLSNMCNMRLLPRVISVCEYQDEGYSNHLNDIMKSNPAGYCLYFMQRVDLQSSYIERLITAGKYQCFRMFSKDKKSDYTGRYNMTVALSKPIGLAFVAYYKLFRGF